jgi:hypothetical protein
VDFVYFMARLDGGEPKEDGFIASAKKGEGETSEPSVVSNWRLD